MKLYNQFKLSFDTAIWGLHLELELFDILLDKNHHFVILDFRKKLFYAYQGKT